MTDLNELKEAMEAESLSLTAASRKVDTLTVFTNLLLIVAIDELQNANSTLKDILKEVAD